MPKPIGDRTEAGQWLCQVCYVTHNPYRTCDGRENVLAPDDMRLPMAAWVRKVDAMLAGVPWIEAGESHAS